MGGQQAAARINHQLPASASGRDYTPGMKNARSALLVLAIILHLSLLAACGNKGDLVRPEPGAESGAGR